ncbi:hypothetical protein JKP88DRAFT_275835 [Tribonema minus]|uniref:Uncharacterized protein n=1 Tax=Tribonema minus TaxID=303371 RepID=A0A835Z7V3_9STRA|nr:hypothetical protein JKP88DRAFT_275835 [Tribonema minus]
MCNDADANAPGLRRRILHHLLEYADDESSAVAVWLRGRDGNVVAVGVDLEAFAAAHGVAPGTVAHYLANHGIRPDRTGQVRSPEPLEGIAYTPFLREGLVPGVDPDAAHREWWRRPGSDAATDEPHPKRARAGGEPQGAKTVGVGGGGGDGGGRSATRKTPQVVAVRGRARTRGGRRGQAGGRGGAPVRTAARNAAARLSPPDTDDDGDSSDDDDDDDDGDGAPVVAPDAPVARVARRVDLLVRRRSDALGVERAAGDANRAADAIVEAAAAAAAALRRAPRPGVAPWVAARARLAELLTAADCVERFRRRSALALDDYVRRLEAAVTAVPALPAAPEAADADAGAAAAEAAAYGYDGIDEREGEAEPRNGALPRAEDAEEEPATPSQRARRDDDTEDEDEDVRL